MGESLPKAWAKRAALGQGGDGKEMPTAPPGGQPQSSVEGAMLRLVQDTVSAQHAEAELWRSCFSLCVLAAVCMVLALLVHITWRTLRQVTALEDAVKALGSLPIATASQSACPPASLIAESMSARLSSPDMDVGSVISRVPTGSAASQASRSPQTRSPGRVTMRAVRVESVTSTGSSGGDDAVPAKGGPFDRREGVHVVTPLLPHGSSADARGRGRQMRRDSVADSDPDTESQRLPPFTRRYSGDPSDARKGGMILRRPSGSGIQRSGTPSQGVAPQEMQRVSSGGSGHAQGVQRTSSSSNSASKHKISSASRFYAQVVKSRQT